MQKCPECGTKLEKIKIGKSKSGKKTTTAMVCRRCDIYYLDRKASTKLRKEMDAAEETKLIRVSKEVWDKANRFVKRHKSDYPSIKYLTQRALLDKISKEDSS